MHFIELETKYKAGDIALSDFETACAALRPVSVQSIQSYDHYYTSGDKFIRHRDGTPGQLTMKEKTVDGNNIRRKEVNLDLSSVAQQATIEEFCKMLGFELNFSIFKDSRVYWYDKFNTVYYVVYEDSSKAKELGRFIEIEMSETYAWPDEETPWKQLCEVEAALGVIGLNPQRRVKKSLFESYRK